MSESNSNTSNKEFMLTTVDNPYDPFTQYEQWFAYDAQLGYNTPGLLARLTITSPDLSDKDQELAITDAMKRIVSTNFFGVHRLVNRKKD